ncbi:hypothetical protein DOE73_29560 [Paenibacillus dendritiformis]|nr:hypothetical protein DOE73_29560 [Paenibacillus dendritiformis]
MNAYETVFSGYVATLETVELERQSRAFYISQVQTILSWTDLTDAKQLAEIRALDHAFRTIVEPMCQRGRNA